LTETALHYFSGYASWTWRASSKKQKSGPYVSEREDSRWFKIRKPEYSQMVGREKLFERERHKESVAGLDLSLPPAQSFSRMR